MYQDRKILIGKSKEEGIYIIPKMANRHGLIAGATGTGKTVTLKVLAESFSAAGIPVFLADAKGDLAGMGFVGEEKESVAERIASLGLNELGFSFDSYPATFWDVYQEKGIPLRTTVSEMGPTLLARIMDLNDTQTDVLTVVFKIADDQNMILTDTKDLKAMLQYVGDNAQDFTLSYGNIAKQSLAAIVRSIVALEAEGGEMFFGEPAVDIRDWFGTDADGKGKIQILDCQKLMNNPTMYATFMLWLMAELFETLPEAGDMEKPRMVFFFDEAHMLFDHAPKALMLKIEQVVKLIRSKGVGIFFITQNPSDIPDSVLAQLGNKIQHALRAYTPAEQKKVKAAAESFRENPEFKTIDVLQELGIGEALVSTLDEQGVPGIVKRCTILPPQSLMGAISDNDRNEEIENDLLYLKYKDYVDNDSAYEFLIRKGEADAAEAEKKRLEAEEQKAKEKAEKEYAALKAKEEKKAQSAKEKEEERQKKATAREIKKVGSSAAGTIGREVGKTLGNSVGGKFGKTLGGNVGASIARGLLNTIFKG